MTTRTKATRTEVASTVQMSEQKSEERHCCAVLNAIFGNDSVKRVQLVEADSLANVIRDDVGTGPDYVFVDLFWQHHGEELDRLIAGDEEASSRATEHARKVAKACMEAQDLPSAMSPFLESFEFCRLLDLSMKTHLIDQFAVTGCVEDNSLWSSHCVPLGFSLEETGVFIVCRLC